MVKVAYSSCGWLWLARCLVSGCSEFGLFNVKYRFV